MVKDQVDDDSLKVLFKQTHGLTYTVKICQTVYIYNKLNQLTYTVVSGWFMEDVLMQ